MEAIVGAHVHDVVYHWIHNIPVIETNSGAEYFHVIYLPFQVNVDGIVTLQNNKKSNRGSCTYM